MNSSWLRKTINPRLATCVIRSISVEIVYQEIETYFERELVPSIRIKLREADIGDLCTQEGRDLDNFSGIVEEGARVRVL